MGARRPSRRPIRAMLFWLLLIVGLLAAACALRWAASAVWVALIGNRWNALDGPDRRR